MNEEKVKILVGYLDTLSKLDGTYHREIRSAIGKIEEEIGVKSNNNISIPTSNSLFHKDTSSSTVKSSPGENIYVTNRNN